MKHRHTGPNGWILPLDQQSPIFDDGAWYRDPSTGKLFQPCHCDPPRTSSCKWCDPVQIYERLNPGKKHPDNLSSINEIADYRLERDFLRSKGQT